MAELEKSGGELQRAQKLVRDIFASALIGLYITQDGRFRVVSGEFQQIASGKATTMGHIKRHHLRDAKCVVPESELLTALDEIFGSCLNRMILCSVESHNLTALRDTLLPRLISGEIRTVSAGRKFRT